MKSELRWSGFVVLLVLGAGLRAIVMILYRPAVMQWFDSPRYARVGWNGMFSDFWMPAGYPMLLRLLQGIRRDLWVTIAAQHLIGLATGTLLFLAMRRVGAPRWAACLPAAVVLLGGDQLISNTPSWPTSFSPS